MVKNSIYGISLSMETLNATLIFHYILTSESKHCSLREGNRCKCYFVFLDVSKHKPNSTNKCLFLSSQIVSDTLYLIS